MLISLVLAIVMNLYSASTTGRWSQTIWNLFPVGSAILAALAIRIRAAWFQALVILWIFAVTSYFNLFRAIGP
ncbi:hypothetical protein P1X14_06660 [Sphingomonas sp. AOB5]|uniref:hypothetical protein n=1 Tax=Sphingomonas sp. AOB5 TaxID=3034017 RepID=UPI0023F678FD|nr:hypothetical protein [Sphingomonas sp. AOB5]MDF7774919.1 hypothetical protein [Sphingomonas sp. AOB5]